MGLKAEEKQEEPKEEKKAEKKAGREIRAKFLMTAASATGIYDRGMTYEVPEQFFTPWESAGVCVRAEA